MAINPTHRSWTLGLALLIALVGSVAAEAQGHRARLSADLEDQLSADSQEIDVIVDGSPAKVNALARRYNLRVKRVMRSGAVLQLTAGQLDALRQDEAVDHLSSDLPVHSTSAITATAIGADQVWVGENGLTPLNGLGVGVAVIDSGIDLRHQALASRVVASVDFTGGTGLDAYGHGTHIAALIAGIGGTSPGTTTYRGMASNAHLINLRVLDEFGAGVASDVIEAIDWAIENRATYGIRVVNLSLGAPVLQSYRDDPLCAAVERAVSAGLIVVAAAGNYGQTAEGQPILGGITSPANDPSAIAVGAVDTHGTAVRSDDTVAPFSSRGPTMYDMVLKPDLVAPGTRVVSAEAQDSYIASTYGDRHVAGGGADAYIQLSGTSMSSAVVSGALAILLEGRPSLTPGSAKSVLQLTSSLMLEAGLVASGAGSLNVAAAAGVVQAAAGLGLPETQIAGESVDSGGIAFQASIDQPTLGTGASIKAASAGQHRSRPSRMIVVVNRRVDSIIWRNLRDHSIVWGNLADNSIVWGDLRDHSIVWGNLADDSIVWGNLRDHSIVWGNLADDSIVWGNLADDSIVWGNLADDSIVWGNLADDSIVWGNLADDSIVWGNLADDSIVWGNLADDSIVWGNFNGEL